MKSWPCGEPSTSGIPRASIDRVNTSSPEFSNAGRSIGRVIRRSTRSGDAPTLRAEFSSEESMPDSAAWQTRNATGTAVAMPSTAMPGTVVRSNGM